VDAYREVIERHGERDSEGLIQSIAQVLATRLRPNSTLARLGGDEFAVLLPDATPALVRDVADDLCAAVREQSHAVGDCYIHSAISIGAVFIDASTPTHHDVLVAADTAVYQAKAGGGDRAVVLFSPSEPEHRRHSSRGAPPRVP
jgi:diguanylate cyclase (GGDEF)-like protein